MKVAIFSDPHMHKFKPFSRMVDHKYVDSTGSARKMLVNSRLLNSYKAVAEIFRWSVAHSVDYVICAGDWFEDKGRIDVDALSLASDAVSILDSNGIPLISTYGNHDTSPASRYAVESIMRLDSSQPVPSMFVRSASVKLPSVSGSGSVRVALHGYDGAFDPNKSLSHLPKSDILVIHQTPRGAVDGYYHASDGAFDANNRNFKKFGCVLCGHIHAPQKVGSVQIIGSPLHYRRGDIGDRGFWVWDDGKLDFYAMNYPKFVTLDDTASAKSVNTAIGNGDYVTITTGDKSLQDKYAGVPNALVESVIDVSHVDKIGDSDPVEVYVGRNDPGFSKKTAIRVIKKYLGE